MGLTRRELVRNSAYAGLGVAVLGRLETVFGSSPAYAATSELAAGYGPLVPDPAGQLDLPRGFSYRVVTQTGEPLKGGGGLVPGSHDGSAAFAAARGRAGGLA
jgi:secreted PhoX family phosphatase